MARGGCFGTLLGCGASVVATVVGLYAFDAYVIAPWAHGNGPQLTRTWVGEFHTPGGNHGFLELDLQHPYATGRNRNYSHGRGLLNGTAHSCGLAQWPAYTLQGTATRSGNDVNIQIAAPRPAPAGLYWHELRGAWSGDSLQLSGVLAAYAGTTSTYHGGAVDENQPTRMTLHPGTQDEFDRACRGVLPAR
jgi:hypothetical protein